MMTEKELVCVNCPKGCRVHIYLENGEITRLSGYSCQKGKDYAQQETIRPMRVLTSTVRIEHGTNRVLPVITSKEIPLDMCAAAMEQIRAMDISAPVVMDQVLVKNFMGTDADLIASRSMSEKETT